ncbi:hypothetical protein FRC17_009482 [Serendipita sp. 399]|nr:hypothetical protein FRC17_009482 [Serendipita sp. 399]
MADSATAQAAAPTDSGAVTTQVDEQPGFKVFAGNLSYTTTDEGLKTFFSPVAQDIISSQVIFRGTRSAGYGFVAFNTAEAAQKAVELLNKKELDGRTLIVEVAKPPEEKEKKAKRTPKKRNSKKSKASTDAEPTTNGTAEATETKEVAENGTTTNGVAKSKKRRNIRNKSKKPKAANADEAAAVSDAAAPPSVGATDAKTPKPKKAKAPKAPKPKRPVGEAPEGEPSKTMLFVANLGFSVDDAALSELFTSAGINVVTARVIRRRWGHPRRSKGYGFVDVGSEDEQKKALEALQGKEIGGREIAVKIAVNSQEKEAAEAEAEAENGPKEVPSLVA